VKRRETYLYEIEGDADFPRILRGEKAFNRAENPPLFFRIPGRPDD